MDDLDLDTAHYLTAGVAVSAVAGAAGWLVYLVAEAITTGAIGIPEHQGARASTFLTGGSIFRTGFVAGLVATAVLWILILLVPTPTRFFAWLGVLVTLAATVLPFTYHVTNASKFWLAAINLVTGLVIVSLLVGIVPKVTTHRATG
ncbi:MAG: DUF6069 family protein [Actinomycetota bacterium]